MNLRAGTPMPTYKILRHWSHRSHRSPVDLVTPDYEILLQHNFLVLNIIISRGISKICYSSINLESSFLYNKTLPL